MEEKKPAAKVITVMTIGMDSRKQAIFRMAFKMYSVQRYQLVEDSAGAAPEVAIIDLDTAGASSLWTDFRAKNPSLPAIAVTVSPTDDAPAPIVTKPVRMENLFPLLRQVVAGEVPARPPVQSAPPLNVVKTADAKPLEARTEPSESSRRAAEVAKAADAVSTPVKQTQPARQATPEMPRPASVVRREPDPAPKAGVQLPTVIERFDPRVGLLGALREIRRGNTPSLVSIAGEEAMVVLPGQDSALLRQDMAALKRACDTPNVTVTVRAITPQDAPPRGASPYSFSALLWQASLWTSRGRLMDGVQVDTPVRLRHWPNLTRLAPTPDAMRIAALWVRFPINLRLTVRMLNVEPSSAFDFLAASHSVGVLDVRESGAEVVALAPEPPATEEQKERGGLLSRLLRKVVRL